MHNRNKLLAASILYPWGIVIFIRALGPIEYNSIDVFLHIHILLFILSYGIGCVTGLNFTKRTKPLIYVNSRHPTSGGIHYNALHTSLFILSVAYFSISIYEAYTSSVITTGITQARYSAIAEGPRDSLVGAIKFLLSGAPVVFACLLISDAEMENSKARRIIGWTVVSACFCSFFLSGGRNAFAISIVVIAIYRSIVEPPTPMNIIGETPKNKPRINWTIKLAILAGIIFSLYLFIERASIRDESIRESATRLAFDYDAKERWFGLDSESPFSTVYSIFLFFIFYITHALNYYSNYISSGYSPMSMGYYNFYFVFNIIDILFGTDFRASFYGKLLTSGVYLSLPGSFYVDFGLAGVLGSGLFIGFLSAKYVKRSFSGFRFEDTMLSSIFISMIVLSPIYSITNIANGLSIIILATMVKTTLSFSNAYR